MTANAHVVTALSQYLGYLRNSVALRLDGSKDLQRDAISLSGCPSMKAPRYTPQEVKELVDRMTTLRTRWLRDVETKLAPRKSRDDALTNREQQVAALVCNGLTNKEIATELELVEGTVKLHVHAIFQKLGVSNRAMLIHSLFGGSAKWP
jgi:DNA-binding NarL/FixJ family response regulator